MKIFKIGLIIFVFCLFLSVPAYAQKGNGSKIAYVDLSRIFDEYSKTEDFDKALEEQYSTYEQERNKKVEKIRDAEGKLALLKEDERKKIEEQIEKDKASLLEFDRQQQTDLRKQRDDRIREILLEIEKVVREYAEKEKYSMIFNDKVLIYSDDALDITEEVIKKLNIGYSKTK